MANNLIQKLFGTESEKASITEEIRNEAIRKRIPVDYKCLICGGTTRDEMDSGSLVRLPSAPLEEENGRVREDLVVPAVGLTCTKCGHMEFFSAVVWGIWEQKFD